MRLFLPLVLAALAIALVASAQSVNWVQYINPTDKDDQAYGVCTFGDYLAVVGEGREDFVILLSFVALIDRATGEVVKMWMREEENYFYDCLSVGNRLYVVGARGIYIFDRELNVVKEAETNASAAITFDGSYLFTAGRIWRDVNGDGVDDRIWRIEKRTLDLDLVAYREYYREWDRAYSYGSYAYDIAINPTTGELWVVGEWFLYNVTRHSDIGIRASWIPDSRHSLLVIFDKELNIKKVVEYALDHENYLEELLGVCFDDDSNAYVVGLGGVAKFDKNGNVMAVNKKAWGYKIACVGDKVYIFGIARMGGYWRHVLYVLDKDLHLLSEHILSKGVEANSWFWGGRPAFDGKNLYVAGWDKALGKKNARVVVYSISLPTTSQTTSPTMSEAIAAPTTAQTANPPPQPRPTPQPVTTPPPPPAQPAGVFLASSFALAIAVVVALFAVARLRRRGAEGKTEPPTQTVSRPRVGKASAVGDFCCKLLGELVGECRDKVGRCISLQDLENLRKRLILLQGEVPPTHLRDVQTILDIVERDIARSSSGDCVQTCDDIYDDVRDLQRELDCP